MRDLAAAYDNFGNESIPIALNGRGLSAAALNTLISGCSELGDTGPAIASAILEWMWATGRSPSLLHYHALLKALGRARRGGDAAAAVIDDLRARGLSPTVITYNLALRALRNCGATPRALALLAAMEAAGAPPDVVSYNTLLAGCHRDADHDTAMLLRAQMHAQVRGRASFPMCWKRRWWGL